MKTHSHILFRKRIIEEFKTIKFDSYDKAVSDVFYAKQTITLNDFSQDYDIRITLTESTSISLTFSLLCILSENENIEQCSNLVPYFFA